MRINLGCGGDILDGWINIDLYPRSEKVIAADIRKLPFLPGSIEEIRAIDVLEHIPNRDVPPTLTHWFALLEHGGTVSVRCPDCFKQCECLIQGTWTPAVWAHMVFGGQDSEGNFHKSGFTPEYLDELFQSAGFQIVNSRLEHELIPSAGNANYVLTAKKP